MKPIWWSVFLLVIRSASLSAQDAGQDCIGREQQAEQMIARGEALAEQEQWEASLAQYRAALEIYRACRNAHNTAVAYLKIAAVQTRTLQPREATATYEQALAAVTGLNLTELEAKIHFNQAWAFYQCGEYPRAIEAFSAARARYRRMPDELMEARCSYGLGHSRSDREEYEAAIVDFMAARQVFEKRQLPEEAALCDFAIGQAHYHLDHHEESLPFFQAAANRFESLNQTENQADCLRFWASAEYMLDKNEHALQLYQQARRLYPSQALLGIALCLNGEGHCYFDLEQYENALTSFQDAAARWRSLGKQERSLATSLTGIGDASFNLQRYEAAVPAYAEAARLYQTLGMPSSEARVRKKRGRALYALGEFSAAFDEAETARSLHQRAGEPGEAAPCYRLMAQAKAELEEYEAARQYYNEAATLFRAQGKPQEEAACFKGIADSYFDEERYPEAEDHYRRAALRHVEAGDPAGEAMALDYAARASFLQYDNPVMQEKLHQAMNLFQQAQERYARLSDSSGQARCLAYFGEIRMRLTPPMLPEAVEDLQNALKLYRSVHDSTGMASCHLKLGKAYSALHQFDTAAAALHNALKLHQARHDTSGLAQGNFELARLQFAAKNYVAAIPAFRHAASLHLAADETANAATCWSNLASAYYNLAEYDSALFAYAHARGLYAKSNQPEEVADTELNMGDTYLALTPPRLNEARRSFETAFLFFRNRRDPARLAHALAGLGNADFVEKKFFEAKSKYEEALKLHREFSAPLLEAWRHERLADIYFELAEYPSAAERYLRAFSIYLQENEMEKSGFVRLKLGEVHLRELQVEKAIAEYTKALRVARQNDFAKLACASLILMGNVWREVDQQDSARVHYEQALRLAESRRDSARVSASLTNIGAVLLSKSEDAAARTYLQRALQIKTAQRDSVELYVLYLNLGNIDLHARRFQECFENYHKALAIALAGKDKLGEGKSLNNLGWAEYSRGNYLDGLRHFLEAERIFEDVVYRRGLISVKANQGVTYEQLQRSQEAYLAYKEAIEIAEQMRANLGRKELLQSFVKSKAALYGSMIDLLLSAPGREQEAAQYILRSQSEDVLTVVDVLAQERGDPELLQAVNELRKQIENPAPSAGGPGASLIVRIGDSKAKLDSLFRAVMPPGTDIFQLERAQRFLPGDAALVTYYPVKNALYAFLVTRKNFYSTKVNVSKAELVEKVRRYRDLINTDLATHAKKRAVITSWRQPEVLPLLEVSFDLHKYLLQPITEYLSGIKTLVIMPWEELNYLPIHALAQETAEGGVEFALQRREIVYLPYSGIIDLVLSRAKPKPRRRIVGLAYPGHPPLLHVRDEINNLKSRAGSDSEYMKFDADATEEYAALQARTCSLLALAAHCRLDNRNPLGSAIMLAPAGPGSKYDGNWTLTEVANSRFENMELAILSGCSTALGGEEPGREIVSMARAFALAGAPAVIASLWSVDDFATTKMMSLFYAEYLGTSAASKIGALQKAQQAMLERPETRHPMYWAPFILIGVWQ
ncbi:MAG: hypothetical protein DKINENOH_03081 [bacterium]|nr:hypothetical protein [bacterium]